MVADQPEPVQGVGVGHTAAVEHVPVLPVALRTVGLDVHARRRCEFAQPGERGIGARRDESGRDDRHDQAPAAVDPADVVDRPCAGGDGAPCVVVPVPVGRAVRMVHGDPADVRPLAPAHTGLGQCVGGFLVDRAVIRPRSWCRARSSAGTICSQTVVAYSMSTNLASSGNVQSNSHRSSGRSSPTPSCGHCGACRWVSTIPGRSTWSSSRSTSGTTPIAAGVTDRIVPSASITTSWRSSRSKRPGAGVWTIVARAPSSARSCRDLATQAARPANTPPCGPSDRDRPRRGPLASYP